MFRNPENVPYYGREAVEGFSNVINGHWLIGLQKTDLYWRFWDEKKDEVSEHL